MGIGAGIFLVAVGAILAFAVNWTASGFNIHTVGVILMIAGVAGIILDVALFAPRRRSRSTTVVSNNGTPEQHVTEARTTY
jgi:hypothetical protein